MGRENGIGGCSKSLFSELLDPRRTGGASVSAESCEGTGADDWPGSILGQRTGSCFWLLSHIFLLDCFRALFLAFSTRSGWEQKNRVLELSLCPRAAPV